MQNRRRRLGQKGLTLLELMIYIGVAGVISMWFYQLAKKPLLLSQTQSADQQKMAIDRGIDLMVNDLREANPASIDWSQVAPLNPTAINGISFSKACYDMTISAPCVPNPFTPFSYAYQASGNSPQGSLVRVIGDGVTGTTTTVIVAPIDAPTLATPLVQQDTATLTNSNLLIITLCVTTPRQKTTSRRRIALMP